MIVRCDPVELDPVYMLMHEPGKFVDHPFDDHALARALNDALEGIVDRNVLEYVRLDSPASSRLSRWMVRWRFWEHNEEEYLADRNVRRCEEVRKSLPEAVVTALRALSTRTVKVKVSA